MVTAERQRDVRCCASVLCLARVGTYLRQRVDRGTEVLSERGMPAWAWLPAVGGIGV
jgi:hypothetical protein